MHARMLSPLAGAIFAVASLLPAAQSAAQELVIIPITPKPQARDVFSESFGKLIRDMAIREERILMRMAGFGSLADSDTSCDEIDDVAKQIRAELSQMGKRVYASPVASFGMRRDAAFVLAAYRVVLERMRAATESRYCHKI